MPIRALKIAVIVMGVMILGGTATLVFLIIQRVSRSPVAPRPPVATAQFDAVQFDTALEEPPGTRIVGIAETPDRLALQLQGGGPDRVVLLDPRTGARAGTVRLAH